MRCKGAWKNFEVTCFEPWSTLAKGNGASLLPATLDCHQVRDSNSIGPVDALYCCKRSKGSLFFGFPTEDPNPSILPSGKPTVPGLESTLGKSKKGTLKSTRETQQNGISGCEPRGTAIQVVALCRGPPVTFE